MALQVTLAVDCRLCVSADAKTTVQYSLLFSIIRMQSCLIEHRKIARQDTLQSQYNQADSVYDAVKIISSL